MVSSREQKQIARRKYCIIVLAVLLFLVVILSLKIGTVTISFREIIEVFTKGITTSGQRIMAYVRGPRVMAAVFGGAGLAVSGAIIQIILANPMAGPNIIGVNAGAGFGAVLCGSLFPGFSLFLPFGAFLGAFITVVFVYLLGKVTGSSKITLVLAGISINSLINAATDTIYTFDDDAILNSTLFRIGGLSGVNINVLVPASIAIIISIIITYMIHNEMELLSLGDETAKTLGLPVNKYRFIFLMLAAVLAGASVSFAGLLGFVGLIVPHMARILIGSECKYMIVVCALLGSIFLTICDFLARVLFSPFELPVGIILSFLGAPFFIYLLLFHNKKRKNS